MKTIIPLLFLLLSGAVFSLNMGQTVFTKNLYALPTPTGTLTPVPGGYPQYSPGSGDPANAAAWGGYLASLGLNPQGTPYTPTPTGSPTYTPTSTPTPGFVIDHGDMYTEYLSYTEFGANQTIQITPPPFQPKGWCIAASSSQPISTGAGTIYNYSNVNQNVNDSGNAAWGSTAWNQTTYVSGSVTCAQPYGSSSSPSARGFYPNFKLIAAALTPMPSVTLTPVVTVEVDFYR